LLKGTLDDFTLSDIFRLTALAKKTGRLEVERRNGSGRVYFRDGDVYYAESTKSKERLGRKLTRSGWLTDRQLNRAVVEQEQTGRRLGEILVGHGAVDDDQVEWAVRSQIEDGVFDLLRWDLGAFVWEPDVEIEVEVPLTVTVENLIIEASRRLDEIAQIRRKIPSANVVLSMVSRPPDGARQINITSDEWQVLVLVDGRRTVEDIATFTGAEAYQTTRLLFGLLNAGLIEHKEPAPGGFEAPDRRSSVQEKQIDRWLRADEQDTNVVELQPEAGDDDTADSEREDKRSAAVAEPDPPATPGPEDDDSSADETRSPRQDRPPPPPRRIEDEDPGVDPAPPPGRRESRRPTVDRAAVVRELAGLFNDGTKPPPKAVPSEPRPEATQQAPPVQKRRVEDDDQVDRKLIGRMIDGVKGL